MVAHPTLLSTVRAAAARVPAIREVISTGADGPPEGVTSFQELLRQGREVTPTVDIDMKRDPVLLLFSSGTTGLPKGVIQTNYCLGSNLLQATSEDFDWELPGESRGGSGGGVGQGSMAIEERSDFHSQTLAKLRLTFVRC